MNTLERPQGCRGTAPGKTLGLYGRASLPALIAPTRFRNRSPVGPWIRATLDLERADHRMPPWWRRSTKLALAQYRKGRADAAGRESITSASISRSAGSRPRQRPGGDPVRSAGSPCRPPCAQKAAPSAASSCSSARGAGAAARHQCRTSALLGISATRSRVGGRAATRRSGARGARITAIMRWNALAMVVRANQAVRRELRRPHRELRLGAR
mgnify:CR=1 FL=1